VTGDGSPTVPVGGATSSAQAPGTAPPLRADLGVWLKIGCLSFGGPAGQIALMQRMLVDELRWIAPERFLVGLDLCMLLPGPEAQQLATYVGWTRQGWRGGLAGGALFVLPGAFVLAALAAIYSLWGALPLVAALFAGVQGAVLAIVVEALVRLGRRALGSPGAYLLAALAFVALALLRVPFPLVVLGAAAGGLLLADRSGPADSSPPRTSPAAPARATWRPALVAALLWLVPLVALVTLLGRDALLARIALRFSELAVLSFGGAYALLSGLAQQAVADGWLTAQQMADGLALAETTPGPLILVLEFVAFVAAHDAAVGAGASAASALGAGALASAVGIWVLFLPSFLWIFLAAPHLERLERWPALRRAVRGVTAAVVGVILNLSLWLALHVLFASVVRRRVGPFELELPELASLEPSALGISSISLLLLVLLRQSLGRTLAVAALLGLAVGLL
jgi:chromate transporter